MTAFVTSTDGTPIAYTIYGSGPALLLIHGFRTNRSIWTKFGWVDRFAPTYQVITVDLRGRGESGAPADPNFYTLTRYLDDLDALITSLGIATFYVFGHSFGAALALRLAAASNNVIKVIGAGTFFGVTNTPESVAKQVAEVEEWARLKAEGKLDELPADQRDFVTQTDLPVYLARVKALAGIPPLEPTDVRHPALLYSGTRDGAIYTTLQTQREAIEAAGHQLALFDDLTHLELVSKIAVAAPTIETFLRA